MKITGRVEIQIKDAQTLELKRRIKQDNLIPDASLLGIFNSGYFNPNYFNRSIVISNSTATPSRSRNSITGILATGYIPSGVTSPRYLDTNDPPYLEIQNRIDPPIADRVFTTVALYDGFFQVVYAYLLLDVPCTQKKNEILDIFYRIQFFNTLGQGLTKKAIIEFGRHLSTSQFNFEPYFIGSTPFAINKGLNYLNLLGAEGLIFCLSSDQGGGCRGNSWADRPEYGSGGYGVITNHFKYKWYRNFKLDERVGKIWNYILHQGREFVSGWQKFQNDTAPFQTLFTHSADATTPFLDSLKLASGNGTLTLSGNWTSKFPQLYKITIAKDGAVGASSYKWSVRHHLGFNGNTYSDRLEPCIFRNPNTPAAPRMHGYRDIDKHVQAFSDTQIVQYDATGVTLLNVINGEYKNWDSTTTPALETTNVGQCAVDRANKKIYVGCRNTGLWVIDVESDSVTRPHSNPCYGVDVGRNNVAFAAISTGLYRSGDWSTPLNFSYTGISDGKWSNVKYIKVDPEHPNDQMCLVTPTRVVWWQSTVAAAVNGTDVEIGRLQTPNCIDVSDSGSFWMALFSFGGYHGRLTFNSTASDINIDSGESYGLQNVTFIGAYFVDNRRLVDKNFNAITTYSNLRGIGNTLCILSEDIAFLGTQTRVLFTGNNYIWKNYGWNGSNWELNHPGAKATHADEQLLGNGINVRFADGSISPHFKTGEFYTQGVCWGLWKDNAIASYYEFGFYVKPVIFDEPLTGTVPTTAPYQIYLNKAPLGSNPEPEWIRAETDQPSVHKILINGVSPIKIYVNNEAPAPNEVTLEGATGKLTFNATNAGATILGTYCYIRN